MMLNECRGQVFAAILIFSTHYCVHVASGIEAASVQPDGSVGGQGRAVTSVVSLKGVKLARRVSVKKKDSVATITSAGSVEVRREVVKSPASTPSNFTQDRSAIPDSFKLPSISSKNRRAPVIRNARNHSFQDGLVGFLLSKISVPFVAVANFTSSRLMTIHDLLMPPKLLATTDFLEPFMTPRQYMCTLIGSSSLLVPATLAAREGWHWLAFIFAARAVLCASSSMYAFGSLWFGDAAIAEDERIAHGIWLSSLYYILLQMALTVMGPEDLLMHRDSKNAIEAHRDAHMGRHIRHLFRTDDIMKDQDGLQWDLPLDVLLLNRFGTSIASVICFMTCESWQGFPWAFVRLCVLAFALNMATFWISRCIWGLKSAFWVLPQVAVWKRVLWLALPVLSVVTIFSAMQAVSQIGPALLRVFSDLVLTAWALASLSRMLAKRDSKQLGEFGEGLEFHTFSQSCFRL